MSGRRVLVTGISGFVGTWLAEELLRRGCQVSGLVPPGEGPLPRAYILQNVERIEADLREPDSLAAAVRRARPQAVAHLAAASAPSKSYADPQHFFRVNVLGTQALFEAVRQASGVEQVAILTSSDIYGIVTPDELPLTEEAAIRPLNPYAASKAACHHLGRQYELNFGLRLLEIRPFNMLGPGQQPGFVLPDFAAQVAAIMRGERPPEMRVGRLTDQRDFVDVRDAARAMAMLIEGNFNGVFHVCSERGTSVQQLLDLLLAAAGMPIAVQEDPALVRPTRMPRLVGSCAKLRQATGWHAEIPLEKTVRDVLKSMLE
jgi:GDP-4-dehydro-6-deoxy-D-mannose reductase